MGNHDHQVVKCAFHLGMLEDAVSAGRARKPWMDLGKDCSQTPEHMAIAQQLSMEDLCFLSNLPLTISLPNDLVVVHAGLMPGVPMHAQTPGTCMFLRSVSGVEGKCPIGTEYLDPGVPWASVWDGPATVSTQAEMPSTQLSCRLSLAMMRLEGCNKVPDFTG